MLEAIVAETRIFEAWSDEAWINDGAAVRVSLVGFGPIFQDSRSGRLDGNQVQSIHADLTAGEGLNLTQAQQLSENGNTSFGGTKKYGDFEPFEEVD